MAFRDTYSPGSEFSPRSIRWTAACWRRMVDRPKFSNRDSQWRFGIRTRRAQSSLRGRSGGPPHVGVGWWIGRSSLIAIVNGVSGYVLAGLRVLSAVDPVDRRMLASDGGSAEVL